MVLHLEKSEHHIRALLDTGCLLALINERTVEKPSLEHQKHKVAESIENYTGESVQGAGQFYMEPLLLQHRKH